MTTALRRRIRHTRRITGYGFLVVLILAAALVGVANQLLPLVERNPDRIAAWLSERVGRTVKVSGAYAEWTRRGPRISLGGLRVGDGADALEIGRAELLVAVYSGLLPGAPLTELKVRDLNLVLEQDDDRRWRVIGLPRSARTDADPLETLEGFGELQVEHASLQVRSKRLGLDARVPRVDLRIRVGEATLRTGVRAWAEGGSQPLTAVAELDRSTWSGTLWAGGERLVLEDWSSLLAATGIAPAGAGEINLWATIEQQKVMQVQVQAEMAPLSLRALDPWLAGDGDAGQVESPPTQFDQVRLAARWTAGDRGWQVHVPQLSFLSEGRTQPDRYDGLWLAGGEVYAMRAPRIALAPVRALLPLSPQLPDGLRRWIYRAAPHGELLDVDVRGQREGPAHGRLRIAGFGWLPAGDGPGVSGLGGDVLLDERGGVLSLDSDDVRFTWPAGFGKPLDLRLAGSIGWWRNAEGWALGTSGLRLRGADYGASLRGELQFQTGSRPRVDVAARLDPADFAAAKRFWVRHKMPETTVKWLDEGLIEGQVLEGRVVLAGDLDDWPFRDGKGRFDARAEVRDAIVKFHPDWPATDDLDVDVSFDGLGMTLAGSSNLLGNRVTAFSGAIPEFKEPVLSLDIQSRSAGKDLSALMVASPLNQRYGEHLKAVRLDGEAAISLLLELPLKKEVQGRRIAGTLDLDGATLADSRWDIVLTDAVGRTRFNEKGFATETLAVKIDGEPASFDIEVGDSVSETGLAALVSLRGSLPPSVLIKRHPPIDWLAPHLSGRSLWDVSVRVPRVPEGRPQPPSQLRLATDLVGMTLTLPAPLAKPAGEALPLLIESPLPLARGDLVLRLGDRLRMRARQREPVNGAAQPGMAGIIELGPGSDIASTLPGDGLLIRGSAEVLDAAGWVGFAAGGEGSGGIRSLDLVAERLDLLGSGFARTRVQLAREPALTRVTLTGEGISGSIDIPADRSRGIDGRFARLHWPEKPAGSAPEPLPAPDKEQDPAKMPALRFTIDDHRLGAMNLGRTEVVTSPLPQGMRVERFQSRAPSLRIEANGDWLRGAPGQNTQSRFQVVFNAGSLGQLLTGFGIAGMVKDGPTEGTLSGTWPGSPGAFRLSEFSGKFKAKVGEGQLLEVEPGGSGRVLGLISLAEIPRRLTLDFSDFFSKGFGFNTMEGDFVFANGKARTDNLQINGPAAEIRVTGSTDLRLQLYDQRVEVLPKAGGVLPALGMVVGGPAGAAVGAVAQAVLQKPLKQAARTVYSITGPWKKPEVVVVEKGAPPAQPRPPKPTTPATPPIPTQP